ncbi:unnamed protein product, partial [Mesorhabditis spiculigera]
MHIKHASCLVLVVQILLIFFHIGLVLTRSLDVWKYIFVPMEVLSAVVLLCGLILEQKNALMPFLFLVGMKIFMIGMNTYEHIEAMFDWSSDKMREWRQELEDDHNPYYNNRKLVRVFYGLRILFDYGTAILCYLVFFYIVWRCRRYFADLAHVDDEEVEANEVENEKNVA